MSFKNTFVLGSMTSIFDHLFASDINNKPILSTTKYIDISYLEIEPSYCAFMFVFVTISVCPHWILQLPPLVRFAVPQSSIFAGFLNMSSYNHCQMPWSRSYESFPPLFLKSYLLQVFKRVYLTSKICLFLTVSCPICGHCDKARASAPFFEGWACEPGLGSLFPCIVHSDCLEDGQ